MSESTPAAKPSLPLSRRIVARTADILAIALLLIISLTMGREVVRWWNTEPPALSPAPKAVPAWGAGGEPVDLEFGESPFTLTRQMFAGDRTAVRKFLEDRCRTAVSSKTALPAAEDRERTTLEKLAALKPIAEQAGVWKIVRVLDPFELTIGMRLDTEGWRIVAWATALPVEPDRWTVHLFTAGTSGAKIAGLPPAPVPPGASRLLSLREANGGSLMGFLGTGPAETWTRYYDGWFAKHGWSCQGWISASDHHTARFRPKQGDGVADVQLVREGPAWRGVVSIMEK